MDYELPNSDGNPYDFGDPEYWESYGAQPTGALAFAQGFPQYWQAVAGWYSLDSSWLERTARVCRVASYEVIVLREELFSLDNFDGFPFAYTSIHLHHYVTHSYQKGNVFLNAAHPPGIAILSTSALGPFATLYEDYPYNDCPFEVWDAIARTFVDAFTNSEIKPRTLPTGLKRRERLPDGAIFEARIRLAHQTVLQNNCAPHNPEQCVRWGPLLYDPALARERHFLVIGATRSGKTSLLRLLLQSLHRTDNTRCIVYDFKTEFIPCLNPSNDRPITDLYHILNPYDARGSAWDIAKDVDENSSDTLAKILIPSGRDKRDEYFTPTLRSILSAIVRALIEQSGERWTFLDLMLALQSDNIRAVLATTAEGRRLYNAHCVGNGQTQQNLISMLDQCSQKYLRIAAAWSKATQTVSLRQWALHDSKGILLGHNSRGSASIKPVILAILHFLFYELTDSTDAKPYHTFMVLDEFRRLGKLPQIIDVVQAAISQKLSLVLGVHDVESIKGVYGQEALGILGPCDFKAILRNTNPDTLAWASHIIGQQDVTIEQKSTSESESLMHAEEKDQHRRRTTGTGSAKNRHHVSRPAVPAEAIMQLPPASPDSGISGYFIGPGHPPYLGTLPGDLFSTFENNEDEGNSVDNYYLWRHRSVDDNQVEKAFVRTPPENFRPPEDSFSTLAALGFQPDHTPHTKPFPRKFADRAEPTEHSADDLTESTATPPPAANKSPSTKPKKNHDLHKMVWDDELETFRPSSEDD